MCLGVPGRVLEVQETEELVKIGLVDFDGVKSPVNFTFLPEVDIGDYVIVHVGFAISKIDADAAASTYDLLREIDALPG